MINGALSLLLATSTTLITHVRIFDGSTILRDDSVIIEGNRIAAIGRDLAAPEGAEVVDGAGCSLLPGLIDAHVHYGSPAQLRQAAVFGVTTELDMGTDAKSVARIKRLENKDAADLRSAGTLVTAPGGHGTEYGYRIPTIASPEEAPAFVDARIAEGSDYIKIIYDDGKTYQPIPTISRDTLIAVIRAAHMRGRLAVVHAISMREARDAIGADCDGLEHLFVDRMPDRDFGRLVAMHHAFVVPTLLVLKKITGATAGAELARDPGLARYLTAKDLADLRTSLPIKPATPPNYDVVREAIRQLRAAGVPILAGTDAGGAHGVLLHRELELLVEAGLSPAEALASATSAPARIFGMPDRGRIAPGLRADLLLVKGDPLFDVRATRNIVRVWIAGTPVDRDAYLASIAPAKSEEQDLRRSAPPPGSESGLVSDFEQDEPRAKFGAGWRTSADSVIGGKSVAMLSVTGGGAGGSRGALDIRGEIVRGYPFPWAGAIFIPGKMATEPVNLSSRTRISFWTKGDGKTYRVQMFARSYGYIKPTKSFIAPQAWTHYTFALSDFDGMDAFDLLGVLFVAGPESGRFAFQIDDVRFE